MKQVILFSSLLFICGALADITPTSVGYIDNALGTLQNKIAAVDTNTVLTATSTAGEIGQKSIYDSTKMYAEQMDALVTATDANAAVQNAIDTEFICAEWLGDEQTNENCLLYKIAVAMPQNLLNPATIHQGTIYSANPLGHQIGARNRCYFDYIPVHAGDIVNFTSKTGTPPVHGGIWLYAEPSESTFVRYINGQAITIGDHTGYSFSIPSDGYIRGIWLQDENFTPNDVTEPMLEISTTPHEYVPYNIYLPQDD